MQNSFLGISESDNNFDKENVSYNIKYKNIKKQMKKLGRIGEVRDADS